MATRRQDDIELSRYVDGELGARAARKVEARLRDDPRARTQVDAFQRQGELLRRLADAQADEAPLDGLWARVAAGLERAPRPTFAERVRNAARRLFGTTGSPSLWLGAGVAVAGAAVLLVVIVRHGGGRLENALPAAISNHCLIEDLEFEGAAGTVLTVPDSHGTEATVIWVTAQGDAGEGEGAPQRALAPGGAPQTDGGRLKL